MRKRWLKSMALSVVALLAALPVGAQDAPKVKIDSNTFGAIEARSIGPAVMSGRIAAIDAVKTAPHIVYVGAAGGGVWKSINGGTSFKPVFDKHTQSIGAIAIDQSKPDTVWVGTGEPWVRNSVSVGTGLYKTTDGGENWQLVGLEKSERIAKIVVDPKNSDVVYVAVLGGLWSANEDRGLYKTTDGGKTWQKILSVDADTGCSDVTIDPQETNIVYAGMWQFRRQPWFFNSGGPGSRFMKSTDGGKTWKQLKNGLPEGPLGRITVAVAPSRPNVVYAVVEAKKTALYRSEDLGESWTQVNSTFNIAARPFYFGVLVVDPKDHNRVYKPGLFLTVSKDGGKSFTNPLSGLSIGSVHSDHHALWINPNNPAHMYLGTDGGVYVSNDYANNFAAIRNLPVSQFYHVAYDMEFPYNVYGGLQDNGAWMAPSHVTGGIQNKHWRNVGGGDGMWTFPDPADNNFVYTEYQGAQVTRFDKRTGEAKSIRPTPEAGDPKFRFNWNTPLMFGPGKSKYLYIGAQFLFRSADKGESWQKISGDLTTNNPEKQKQEESGGLSIDNSTAENHCTIFTISESPLDENTVWAGTDDGNVQITRDGGKTWTNVVANIPGLPANTWVSCIEASRFDAGTAYATFDGHQTGDMKTYVYKTTDFGTTWTALATDAIAGYAHVIREDLQNRNLLFVGTEFGLFLTVDGGRQWVKFTGKLPSVAVRDIAIHPREGDVLLATHGRGIHIIDDITPIRNLTEESLSSPVVILPARPSKIMLQGGAQEFNGNDEFIGEPLSESAYITYYLKDRHQIGDFKIEVYDAAGKLLSTLAGGKRRGINRVEWQMRLKPPKTAQGATLSFGAFVGPTLPEGEYTAKIIKGKDTFTTKIVLVGDPRSPHSAEDRRMQQETVLKLYRMQEQLSFVAATITDARDQARDRAKKVREGNSKDGEALAKSLDAFAAKLDDLNKKLVPTREGETAGYIGGEERLRERIVELYGNVNSFGGRPTKSQLDGIAVLTNEIGKAEKDYAGATAELDSLNTKLKAKTLDPIKPMTREEYEKKNGGASGAMMLERTGNGVWTFRPVGERD